MRGRIASLLSVLLLSGTAQSSWAAIGQPKLADRDAPVLTQDGLQFRDLDRNGTLEPYEDWRLSPELRARDLVQRMSLDEQAALLVHPVLASADADLGSGKHYDLPAAASHIARGITSFLSSLTADPATLAHENNLLQEAAARGRWGIPLTLSSDPRNQDDAIQGLSVRPAGVSVWPQFPAFAAIGDPALTREFGDVVRQEYRAVGLQMAFSPQADLATEPRWARISGTFGEDAQRAATMVAAYVEGLQGGAQGVSPVGVAAVVKHWIGTGAARDGWDSHNYYGRYATFGEGGFGEHLIPFQAAFAVHAAAVMTAYPILQGAAPTDGAQVGAAFNPALVTKLLKEEEHFDGLVVSDFAILDDCPATCRGHWRAGRTPVFGMPWGVEGLSREARFARAINAGVDQIGGSDDLDLALKAIRQDRVEPPRVAAAAKQVLALKFRLGLFEDPYVDEGKARDVAGAFRERGEAAQRRAIVLLENRGVLPLRKGARLYLEQVDAVAAQQLGFVVVASPEQADFALLRIGAPFEDAHPHYFFGSLQHEGRLDFEHHRPLLEHLRALASQVRTIVVVGLDRPAILTDLQAPAAALVGEFGIQDLPLLGALSATQGPSATLPFELPSSMAAVRKQAPDRPHDTAHPLYQIHYGQSW